MTEWNGKDVTSFTFDFQRSLNESLCMRRLSDTSIGEVRIHFANVNDDVDGTARDGNGVGNNNKNKCNQPIRQILHILI